MRKFSRLPFYARRCFDAVTELQRDGQKDVSFCLAVTLFADRKKPPSETR